MLFMFEFKHSPGTCIAAREKNADLDAQQLRELRNIAMKLDSTIIDGWSFPVGHQLWYVIDAPESHVVADVFFESRAFRWNTVTINPVMNHDSFIKHGLNPIADGEESEEVSSEQVAALS